MVSRRERGRERATHRFNASHLTHPDGAVRGNRKTRTAEESSNPFSSIFYFILFFFFISPTVRPSRTFYDYPTTCSSHARTHALSRVGSTLTIRYTESRLPPPRSARKRTSGTHERGCKIYYAHTSAPRLVVSHRLYFFLFQDFCSMTLRFFEFLFPLTFFPFFFLIITRKGREPIYGNRYAKPGPVIYVTHYGRNKKRS